MRNQEVLDCMNTSLSYERSSTKRLLEKTHGLIEMRSVHNQTINEMTITLSEAESWHNKIRTLFTHPFTHKTIKNIYIYIIRSHDQTETHKGYIKYS